MLFLNLKKENKTEEIMIGKYIIKQVNEATLLGIKMTDDQKWNEQILGTGGVISSLNQRFFLLTRLKNKLSRAQLWKIADSIFISKIRYVFAVSR